MTVEDKMNEVIKSVLSKDYKIKLDPARGECLMVFLRGVKIIEQHFKYDIESHWREFIASLIVTVTKDLILAELNKFQP